MFLKKVRLYGFKKCAVFPISLTYRFYSIKLEKTYTDDQTQKILKIVNGNDEELLSRYDLSKVRLKKFTKWKTDIGEIKSLSDIEVIDGFTQKSLTKFLDSIVDESYTSIQTNGNSRVKGQILHPTLTNDLRQKCKTVLAVYTTVNSVCWSLVEKEHYQLLDWQYYPMEHPDGKKIQITDILNTAWEVTKMLPMADIYVMKSEETTLRAAGSDPNNPKVISVNLQKSQLVAMMVALMNSRQHQAIPKDEEKSNELSQKVFFLRSSLPYRLFGTLVGNERVSSEQTVETLLSKREAISVDNSNIFIPKDILSRYRAKRDLEKDMLGQCLFLALTFMDLCIYRNESSVKKLVKVK